MNTTDKPHADAAPETTRLRPATPEDRLAEAFARHVRAWSTAAGAEAAAIEAAAEAARRLSLATREGHVCLDLEELPARTAAAGWRELLLRSGVAGTADRPGSFPLVLDDEDRLYLHRDFDLEVRLARRFVQSRKAAASPGDAAAGLAIRLAPLLARSFPHGGPDAALDWQKLAVAMAVRNRFTVISGGPGTGKTTVVVSLLACLAQLVPGCRIALAAPTGKAAARLAAALRERAGGLDDGLRAVLPESALTVHRLLGLGPDGRARHHARQPLPIDVLVVDEASMIDLALATRLLEAVPPQARIVLLGDKDQLAAVEAGAVFAELCAGPALGPATVAWLSEACATPAAAIVPPAGERGLPDTAVWFSRNYRFGADSGIGRLAASVRQGDAESALALLQAGGDDLRFWPETDSSPGAGALAGMDAGYAPYLEALRKDPGDVARATAAFERFRVLCAQRAGPRGVEGINRLLSAWLRDRLGDTVAHEDAADWFTGRPVIVLENDYVLRLFNGDIGLALPDASGELRVHFPDPQAPGRFRAVAPVRLPRHETAFALTVHKSQGSEFDEVLLVLPRQPTRSATRELVYTGLTRARRRVSVEAAPAVLAHAIATSQRRRTGLRARIRSAGRSPAEPA